MVLVDDPQSVWETLTSCDLPIFPAVPAGGSEAFWPDADVTAFIGFAEQVGARVLYVRAAVASALADARREQGRSVPPDLRGRADEVAVVWAAFALDGVVHRFEAVARWFDAACAQADVRADLDRHDLQARVDAMAREVVGDRAFWDYGVRGPDRKREVVETAFPDLDEMEVEEVMWAAVGVDRTELKPDREGGWAEHARRERDAGRTKVSIAEEIGITVNVLNRVMQENPPQQDVS